MYSPQTQFQQGLHRSFRADGTLSSSVTPKLILPVVTSRCTLLVMNCSGAEMWLEHGPCRATATISGGAVTALTVTNAGFGYTTPPIIELVGGGPGFVTSTWGGNGQFGMSVPSGAVTTTTPNSYNHPAKVRAVLSGGSLSSFVIDEPGAGYVNPPQVVIYNAPNDPFGCADPSLNISGTMYNGVYLPTWGGSYMINGTACHTDQIALFGTNGSAYVVEYMV